MAGKEMAEAAHSNRKRFKPPVKALGQYAYAETALSGERLQREQSLFWRTWGVLLGNPVMYSHRIQQVKTYHQ